MSLSETSPALNLPAFHLPHITLDDACSGLRMDFFLSKRPIILWTDHPPAAVAGAAVNSCFGIFFFSSFTLSTACLVQQATKPRCLYSIVVKLFILQHAGFIDFQTPENFPCKQRGLDCPMLADGTSKQSQSSSGSCKCWSILKWK